MKTALKIVARNGVCGGLALGLAVAASGVAQTASPDDPLQALKAAAEAARVGEARQDPWALALAVRLRRTTPLIPVDRRPEGATERTASFDPSVGWLARARALGRYDRRLQAFLDEVEAGVLRGRSGGPRVSTADLGPAAAHRYRETFQPSRPAAVYVEGDGDTDLSLQVIGSDGATACVENGPGDIKLCAWTPRAPGPYTIEVTNRGSVRNRYALATN